MLILPFWDLATVIMNWAGLMRLNRHTAVLFINTRDTVSGIITWPMFLPSRGNIHRHWLFLTGGFYWQIIMGAPGKYFSKPEMKS